MKSKKMFDKRFTNLLFELMLNRAKGNEHTVLNMVDEIQDNCSDWIGRRREMKRTEGAFNER